MGDLDIDIEVEKADRVAPALTAGLREGLEEGGEWLMREGEDRARDIVMTTDRVWRKTVKQGFTTDENEFNRSYHWKGEIRNEAPHAEIVEKGLAPAGEITGSTPSVQDIIPWVNSELTPNAEAQASADAANVGNWDPQLATLAKKYSPGDVITAFAVKNHIADEGYPGIGFMETTESYLNQVGPRLVKQKVEKHMRRELRAAGLK